MDEGRNPRILLIVVRNISGLDYAVPLLWRIKRENPQAEVSVLYCWITGRKILRESRYYSDILRSCGIPEYDFADFLRNPYVRLRGLWHRLPFKPDRDSLLQQRSRRTLLPYIIALLRYVLIRIESFLSAKVNVQRILPWLDPDIILFDNRSHTAFRGREHFYDYFASRRKKVVLLPHAPHHTGTTTCTPFDEQGEALPDYCEFWMPFRFDRCWEKLPEKKSQFAYVGYPGLDSEWLSFVQSGNTVKRKSRHRSYSARPARCLFVIRNFRRKGQPRPLHDAYIYGHDEFTYYLNLVRDALRQADVDIELVIKPHPGNDFLSVSAALQKSRIPRWSITHDSIYAELTSCDFVISLYSTTMLIPAMAGIPVILLHSRIQDEIHQWNEMKQLYTGLHFYLENPEDLLSRIKEVLDIVSERRWSGAAVWSRDIEHLRYFYPDGAMQRCLDRLRA